MEDVVLHYKPGLSQNLSALIQTTEKLLAPFPCRRPQVFTPWFPSIVERHLPLKPARSAPVIRSVPDQNTALTNASDQAHGSKHKKQTGLTEAENKNEAHCESDIEKYETSKTSPQGPHEDKEVPFVPETPPDARVHLRSTPASSDPTPPSRIKRCWTIFKNKQQPKGQTKVQPMSRRLHQTVSKLQLQVRQRVKWVITPNNCTDIEQVWCALSRSNLSSGLPSCNAHIDREHAEVWVFSDLMYSEQVGLFLKQELNLRGPIHLWARKHGHIYTI